VGIRLETREGEANRGKKKRKRQIDKDRAEREEEQRRKEIGFLKDLCINLENCRGSFVK
jgi:hypothetical protein